MISTDYNKALFGENYAQYLREYYQECSCGAVVATAGLKKHQKTGKHRLWETIYANQLMQPIEKKNDQSVAAN